MSIKTPCQEAPEAWVGNDDQLRAQAAIECRTICPVYAQCKAGVFGKPGPEDHGVWAGVDLSARPVKVGPPRTLSSSDRKECTQCGATIVRKRQSVREWDRVRFCSQACRGASQAIPGLPETKPCELCGQSFTRLGRSPSQWVKMQFCSVACSGASRRVLVLDPPVKVCEACKGEFTRPRGQSTRQWAGRRFCSIACATGKTATA